jgi:hypothetical protein
LNLSFIVYWCFVQITTQVFNDLGQIKHAMRRQKSLFQNALLLLSSTLCYYTMNAATFCNSLNMHVSFVIQFLSRIILENISVLLTASIISVITLMMEAKHLWNVGQFLPDYMEQHPRRQSPSSVDNSLYPCHSEWSEYFIASPYSHLSNLLSIHNNNVECQRILHVIYIPLTWNVVFFGTDTRISFRVPGSDLDVQETN